MINLGKNCSKPSSQKPNIILKIWYNSCKKGCIVKQWKERKILIFTDNIPRGIRTNEVNSFWKMGRLQYWLRFLEAASRKYLHYFDIYLEDPSAAPCGFCDLINYSNKSSFHYFKKITENYRKDKNCKGFNIWFGFDSELVTTYFINLSHFLCKRPLHVILRI